MGQTVRAGGYWEDDKSQSGAEAGDGDGDGDGDGAGNGSHQPPATASNVITFIRDTRDTPGC